jgi:hypothetical protein
MAKYLIIILLSILGLSWLFSNRIDDPQPQFGNFEENSVLKISHIIPPSIKVGDVFEVILNVEVKKSLAALSVREALAGLLLNEKGDFLNIKPGMIQGVMLNVEAGKTFEFSYTATCEHPITYTVTGFAETNLLGKRQNVWSSAKVNCT